MARYRCYFLGIESRILALREFKTESDNDALTTARTLALGHQATRSFELWEATRYIRGEDARPQGMAGDVTLGDTSNQAERYPISADLDWLFCSLDIEAMQVSETDIRSRYVLLIEAEKARLEAERYHRATILVRDPVVEETLQARENELLTLAESLEARAAKLTPPPDFRSEARDGA